MVGKNTTPKAKSRAATPAAQARRVRTAKSARPALAKPLSGDQVVKLLSLAKQATSVEVKLSVPLADQRATVRSIGLDPVEAQPRQAFFFDTPDLALYKAGVVVRARRSQGGDGDTVIKLRPVDPAAVDPELRRSAAFKIEVDTMPGGFVCSASFKGVCDNQDVLDVVAGKLPLRKLFSKEQRAFYDEHAPARITMDKLVLLGPTFLLRSKHQPKSKDFDRPVVVELWLYPDGSIIMEVSTKAMPKEAFQVITDFKAFLAAHGIVLGADQSAKTRTTLEFYAARLKKMAGQSA